MRVPWGGLLAGTGLLVLATGAGLGAAQALGHYDPDRSLATRCEEELERPAAAEACLRDLQPPDRLGPFDDEVGVVVVGLGLLIGVGALLCALAALEHRRHASDPPRRWFYVFTNVPEVPGGTTRAVGGTVACASTLRAPLTRRSCVAWGLQLSRHDHDHEAGLDAWTTVWQPTQVQDLEIAYDVRWTHDARLPEPERPDLVPGSGTVRIAGDLIEVRSLCTGSVAQEVALDNRTLSQLGILGIADDLQRDIATAPDRYRLVENCLATGDFVRCYQNGDATTFSLLTGAQDAPTSGCLGLAVLLLYISFIIQIIGFALITGWQNTAGD